MVQVRKLGVRPYPEENESHAGYLLRLAKLNGFEGLKDFFGTIGVKPTMVKNVGRWSSDQLLDCFTKLSPYMHRSPETLFSGFAKYFSMPWVYREKRMIQDLRLNHPRICPECIAEGRSFDWRWGMAHVSHCPHHHCQLIESCPDCEKPLDWKRELITGCSCGYKHHASKPVSHAEVSELEQNVWQSALSSDELDSICEMIVKLSRPYDSFHQSCNAVSQEHGYSELVHRSYLMLENTDIQQEWIDSVEMVRDGLNDLGNKAVRLPVDGLNRIARSDSRTSTYAPMHEYTLFVKPSRRNKTVIKSNEDIRYQVRASDLASVMGIPSAEIQHLIDGKVTKPANSTNVLRDQLFDLRTLLCLRTSTSSIDDYVRVSLGSKALTKHLTSYGRLLADVIKNKINGAFFEGYNFTEIRISPADLSNWLTKELNTACQEPVPAYKAKAVIGCSDQRLHALVAEGSFYWARCAGSMESVDGDSFLRYIKYSSGY